MPTPRVEDGYGLRKRVEEPHERLGTDAAPSTVVGRHVGWFVVASPDGPLPIAARVVSPPRSICGSPRPDSRRTSAPDPEAGSFRSMRGEAGVVSTGPGVTRVREERHDRGHHLTPFATETAVTGSYGTIGSPMVQHVCEDCEWTGEHAFGHFFSTGHRIGPVTEKGATERGGEPVRERRLSRD